MLITLRSFARTASLHKGILSCFLSCHLLKLTHDVFVRVVPVLVICQSLARNLVQNAAVDLALIRVKMLHQFEDIFVSFQFVPFLCFVYRFQVIQLQTVRFEGVDQVALMSGEGNFRQKLAESLCLDHRD